MKLEDATALAKGLIALLGPYCERIEIAGSIRRGKPEVKDIELVAEPKEPGLLQPGLHYILDGLRAERVIAPGTPKRWGQRYRHFAYQGAEVDLFVVLPPAQWGVIFTIRTGPARYSESLMLEAKRHHLAVQSGALYRMEEANSGRHFTPVSTPEEEDFFRALGLIWVAPEKRG